MKLARCKYYVRALPRSLLSTQALATVLSAFGALWLGVEVITYFFPTAVVCGNQMLPDAIRAQWPWFGLVGLAVAVYRRRPRLSVSHSLSGRDVIIELAVGDVFSFPGALIVGSNTTFDTRVSPELISERSVQGAFTKKYYASEERLDADLAAELAGVQGDDLQERRVGKSKKYPMGTCVRLNPKGRTCYLLASAHMNAAGGASGSLEDLKVSLPSLWEFIGRRGSKGALVMPILGTGFSRLSLPREEVIREIIQSFVAACSEMTLADKLTIVIWPDDMVRFRISLADLDSFLRHVCRYTAFTTGRQRAVGIPV